MFDVFFSMFKRELNTNNTTYSQPLQKEIAFAPPDGWKKCTEKLDSMDSFWTVELGLAVVTDVESVPLCGRYTN